MVMQQLNTGTTGKVFKYILMGVLFAAIAGLALTDMGGFFRTGSGSNSVATVGSDDINIVSFHYSYQRALEQSRMQDAAARQMGLPFMVLQQEITREVLRQAAEKSGIRVDRRYVANFLTSELKQIPGPGTPQEKLAMLLQKQNLSEKTLTGLLSTDVAIDTTINAVTTEADMPQALVIAPWRAVREKRNADIIKITAASVKNSKKLDQDALENYYKEHKEEYRKPEKRGGEILVIPQSKLIHDISISDKEISDFYNANQNQFMSSSRVRFEQIILQDEEKAESIADKKPESLEKFKGDKADYIAADWYSESNLPKELRDAVYPEKKPGLIGPVKTMLGWHVLRVKEYQAGKTRPLSEVKSVLSRQLKDEKLDSQLSGVSDRIDEMVVEGSGLVNVAREFNVTPSSIAISERQDAATKIKSLGVPETAVARIADALFSLDEEEVSPVQELPNGDIVLLHLTDLEPSVVPAFDKIKDRVSADANKDAQTRAMGQMAEELVGKYGTDEFNRSVEKYGLSRSPISGTIDSVQSSLGQQGAHILFSLSNKSAISYVAGSDSVSLIVLKSVEQEKGTPDAKTIKELQTGIRDSLSRELQAQFVQAWQNKLGVNINETLMQRQFAPQNKEE